MDGGAPSRSERDGDAAAVRRGSAAETSRQRLIAAGVELVVEHYETGAGLRDVFAYITPSAVAERAGVSRGLIYHHWGGPDDGSDPDDGAPAFNRFLTSLADALWTATEAPAYLTDLADLLPDSLGDVVLGLVAVELDRFAGRDRALLRASQALTVHGAWPEGAEVGVLHRTGLLYEHLGAKLGLEPIPPLTFADVGLAVMCVLEGFAMFQNVLREDILAPFEWSSPDSGERSEQWTLASVTIDGVVRSMTRPVASPGKEPGPGNAADEGGGPRTRWGTSQ